MYALCIKLVSEMGQVCVREVH